MDQNSDSNFAAFELLKQSNALPTFISERSTSTDSFEKLASELFADRDNREYPIDTKENTFYPHYISLPKEIVVIFN